MSVFWVALLMTGQVDGETPDAKAAAVFQAVDRIPAERTITAGSWWNLYFADGNDPLKRGGVTIRSVRVIQVDPKRANWVRVANPDSLEEHRGFPGIATESVREKRTPDEMIAALGASVSEWRTAWVNLDYVVRMTSVSESHERRVAVFEATIQPDER